MSSIRKLIKYMIELDVIMYSFFSSEDNTASGTT